MWRANEIARTPNPPKKEPSKGRSGSVSLKIGADFSYHCTHTISSDMLQKRHTRCRCGVRFYIPQDLSIYNHRVQG